MSFIETVSDLEELAVLILNSKVCRSKHPSQPDRRFYPKKVEFVMGQFYVSGTEDGNEVMCLLKLFTKEWVPCE